MERSEPPPVRSPEVVEFVHGGVAVGVATCDENPPAGVYACAGAEGVRRSSVAYCLCVGGRGFGDAGQSGAQRSRRGRVLSAADRQGCPAEGRFGRVGSAGPPTILSGSGSISVGSPSSASGSAFHAIGEAFDQTPGPTAGRRLCAS